MPPRWMPGADVTVTSSHDGGSMIDDGHARFTWHTYEAGYGLGIQRAAKALVASGNEVHFVFHPLTGQIAQILPADRAARGLKNAAGGVQTNRLGRVHLQVEVIAYASSPWTLDLTPAGRAGLAKLVEFARAWGVPDAWPAGPPPAYRDDPPRNIPSSPRSATTWTGNSGHFGHSQVPENNHGDPGAIDFESLLQSEEDDDMRLDDTVTLHGYAKERMRQADGTPMGSVLVRQALEWSTAASMATDKKVTELAAQVDKLTNLVQVLVERGQS